MDLVDEHGNPIGAENVEPEAQAKGIEVNRELAQRRLILNADQLASLIAPRARFEIDFLPRFPVYFFSIDGVLNGAKITGAMFAGECIKVEAPNFLKAQELANSGLRSTVEFLHREYETRALRMDDLSLVEQGLAKDVAGRRGREGDGLAKNPKLKHMLEHVIGGLPWRW